MIRILLIFAALLALAGCKEDSPTASRETSPGGIGYTLIHLPGNPDVTIHAAWPTDWAYRADTNKAAPTVGIDLLLTGGAEGYPAGDAPERFADLNSEADIFASVNDHIVGQLTFEIDHLAETVAIANAHLRAPTLDPDWFARIEADVAQSLAEAQAQPVHAGFDAVRWSVFGEQPLRNGLSLDEPGVLQSLTRMDVVAWHAETFTNRPDAVVVAGGLEAEAAGAAVDALFAGLPEPNRTVSRDVSPDFRPRRILLHRPDAETTTLSFVAPLPPTRQGGEFEDLILIHALGGGDQSALFDAVRTDLRASYAFGSGIANFTRELRLLFMAGEVAADTLGDAEGVVRDAYAAFREVGPQGWLDDRKAPFAANLSEMPDFIIDLARSELQSQLDGYAPGRALQMPEELDAVTETSLLERLRAAYPAPDDFIIIAVSPDADALPGACVIATPPEAAACP
jgi:zinc protease